MVKPVVCQSASGGLGPGRSVDRRVGLGGASAEPPRHNSIAPGASPSTKHRYAPAAGDPARASWRNRNISCDPAGGPLGDSPSPQSSRVTCRSGPAELPPAVVRSRLASAFGPRGWPGSKSWRNRVRRIRPVDPRQVVQRDTRSPAIRECPEPDDCQHGEHREAQHAMRTQHSEVDQRDDRGDWQTIAEDDEGPRITWITCIDQAAD